MKYSIALLLWLSLATLASAELDTPVVETLEVRESYAKGGDPSAQFNLGLAYARGEGMAMDPVQAFAWFKASAERSYPEGEFNLAICYLNGSGVPKDEKEAMRWAFAAARQGVLPAQLLMVRNFSTGTGVEKSPAKALAWDFIARRTLTLKKGASASAPPVPGKMRADGAVELTGADGRRAWVFADRSRESAAGDGSRVLAEPDGSQKTIYADGAEQTARPDGVTEWKLPDGTQILSDQRGVVQAKFPDGRTENRDGKGASQIILPDGSKTLEGPGTTTNGDPVKVKESYDAQGTLTEKRVVDGEKTVVFWPGGKIEVEFAGEDPEGKPLKLVEEYDAQGELLGRELVKSDGTHRKGTEEWTIVRWLRNEAKERLHVRETYGLGGSIVQQEELAREAAPVVRTAPAPVPLKTEETLTRSVIMRQNTGSVPTMQPVLNSPARTPAAPAQPDEVKIVLTALAELEKDARNFAGATEADYKTAQAQAAQYVIAFDSPPQKNDLNWMKFKTAQLVAPQPRLTEIRTDLSEKYPFGQNGSEATKELKWKHAESDHFVVHFTELSTAAPVMNYLENAYCVVAQLLQVEEMRGAAKSHVFVFPDLMQWHQWLGNHHLPDEVAGYAYKTELLLGAGSDKDEYVRTICHEATHAIVARYYPGRRLPLWLNEGVAEYAAARAVALKRGQKLQKYLSAGALEPDLRALFVRKNYEAPSALKATLSPTVNAFGGPAMAALPMEDPMARRAQLEKVRTFYRTSERCVMALNERVGSANFPKFLNLLAAGNPADVALKLAYGAACDSPEALARLLGP